MEDLNNIQKKNRNSEDEYFAKSEYMTWIHKIGRISSLISLSSMMAIPIASAWITGTRIDIGDILLTLASLMAFIVLGSVEPFSYAPILGASGTYIAFITGKINVCFGPIAANMDKLKAEPNSKKHEIIASIVTGVMSLTGIALMTLAMVFLGAFSSALENPILQPGYDNMTFAMIGAFSVPMILRNPKMALAPGITMFMLTLLFGATLVIGQQSIILPIMLLIILPVNFILYKKNFFDKK